MSVKKRKPKHVIVLGAGASASSGYPVAEQLRKEWLASGKVLLQKATDQILMANETERQKRVNATGDLFREWYQVHERSMELFRSGGFGTIDEFCYHARRSKPDDVQKLKAVLRFALGVHNPEAHFHKSDYYNFIQKLFLTERLSALRDDTVVLSFNYDPYLEWLLERAVRVRLAEIDGDRGAHISTIGRVTSGFFGGSAGLRGLSAHDGFCILKLHGIIAWPAEPDDARLEASPMVGFNDVFTERPEVRAARLMGTRGRSIAPMIFPWELFDDKGHLVPETEFPVQEPDNVPWGGGLYLRGGARTNADPSIYEIFQTIWKRAREEMRSADRISFIGTSMHPYLRWGLRHLLEGRKSVVSVTITDPRFDPADEFEPTTPTFRMKEMFKQLKIPIVPLKVRQSFSDFIERDIQYAET